MVISKAREWTRGYCRKVWEDVKEEEKMIRRVIRRGD